VRLQSDALSQQVGNEHGHVRFAELPKLRQPRRCAVYQNGPKIQSIFNAAMSLFNRRGVLTR
jgi:hypothetical protein